MESASLCRLAVDFDVVPSLASRKRITKLHYDICRLQSSDAADEESRPRGMTYAGFLLLLGRLAISEFRKESGESSVRNQLISILKIMDRSGGRTKLANSRGVRSIPRMKWGPNT